MLCASKKASQPGRWSLPSSLQSDSAGNSKRRKDNFSGLPGLVLDDIGDADIEPTYKLETSPGKHHLGFRLDVPIRDPNLADRLIKAVIAKNLLGADSSGNNSVRYMRLPAAVNMKHSPPFRHRMVSWNPHLTIGLDDLCGTLGIDFEYVRNGESSKPSQSVSGGLKTKKSDADLIAMVVNGESWHDPLNILAARYAQRGMTVDDIVATLQGHMEAAHDGSERWQQRYNDIMRSVRGAVERFAPPSDPISRALMQSPTQDNVALLFARQFAGKLLYNHGANVWLEWDGTRWRPDRTDLAFDYARAIARTVNTEGRASIASAAFCKGVESFCQADRTFARSMTDFDVDNYMLNTPGGTVDLRTGEMLPHDPAHMITLSTAVAPSTDGGEVFRQFMKDITLGDLELQIFLQVALGSILSGAIEQHWLMFWTGTGRNGKNTLGDLVMAILADYARKIPSSTLMAKTHEEHPTELASLKGIRLATSSEVGDGDHWHEARINELTGDAVISARYMRGDYFEFNRTHKHLIYGNHRPQLRTVTEALKSRLKIVPFKTSFIGREDPDMPQKLWAEAGYVLNWLIDGHVFWVLFYSKTLPACAAVEAESADYFEAQSTVDAWISECVERVPDDRRGGRKWPKSSELYQSYVQWKRDRGEAPVSQTRWADTMAKRFTKVRADGLRYVGAVLLSAPNIVDPGFETAV